MNHQKILKIFTPLLIGATMAVTFEATGQNLKLNPIKPSSNKILTDEQQGILAVRKAKASVVNISGVKKIDAGSGMVLQTTVNQVNGTGFIISADGLVVSNSHVVEDKQLQYFVIFADGKELPAKVLGLDSYNDVALLKIEDKGLPAATFGNSDGLETGQSVFAIGNSLGRYQNTVTRGVVSGVGRAVDMSDLSGKKPRLINLIQTDASINVGNSGGPLVNMLGEVVGMNTLFENEGRGVGFAVPINTIKLSIEQLKTYGKVSRPYMGVSYITLNRSQQLLRDLPVFQGALIDRVADGGPAAASGLKAGDIIISINRQSLNEKQELDVVINQFMAGTQIMIKILRDKEEIDLPLILGEFK